MQVVILQERTVGGWSVARKIRSGVLVEFFSTYQVLYCIICMAVFEAAGGRRVVTAEDMLASSGLDGKHHS